MQIHIHHRHTYPAQDGNILLAQRLDWLYAHGERLHGLLEQVISNQEKIMASLDDVLAAVNDESTREDSLVALLTQLREQITGLTSGALPPDVQAKVDAVFNQLTANKAKLAKAMDNPGSNSAPAPVASSTGANTAAPTASGT